MEVTTARQIAEITARLAELVATFQARFGTDYRMTPNSPAEAWEMYRAIMAAQTQIANLLDPMALKNAFSRYGQWWERADVMSCIMVKELSMAAFDLIGRCAYDEQRQSGEVSAADLVIQQSIAGMLHPATRPMGVQHSVQVVSEAS